MGRRSEGQVEPVATNDLVLGVIGSVGVHQAEGQWYTHLSFARVLNLVGPCFRRVIYLAKEYKEHSSAMDCALDAEHIEVWPGPSFAHSIDVLRHPLPVLKGYRKLIDACDVVFARGANPLSWYIHARCARRRRPIVQWLVGNPVVLLRMESRFGGLKNHLTLAYTIMDEWALGLTARWSRAKLISNGAELGHRWRAFKPKTLVSSTISIKEFRQREDTCRGERICLKFVGFIRPEKGLEYLVRALPLIRSQRPVDLSIVGPREGYPAEVQRIERVIAELGLADRVRWEGYAAFGEQLFAHLDGADILVLPTLSEGTPRVLVEARARSVPVVSTTVGGIPTSVENGIDGLLVPPKDPQALGEAISRVINDGELRRRFIENGFERVKAMTVERFTEEMLDSIRQAVVQRGCRRGKADREEAG